MDAAPSMSAEQPPPPPFYCPACGKKHRADLSALQGTAGAQAKVVCARCEAVMSIFLGKDGLPKCEVRERPAAKPEPAIASTEVPAAARPPSDGGTMSKSSLPLQLAAAAVIAAVVSFAVVSATKPAETPKDPGVATGETGLGEKVAQLETRLATSEREVQAGKLALVQMGKDLRAAVESNAKGLNAQGKTLSSIEQLQSSTNAAVKKIGGDYKGLNGRIEGNYNRLNGLDGRVKKIEGK